MITSEAADHALSKLEVDHLGLDAVDRRMLTAIVKNYGGGPVGLETLAATIGEEAVTLEDVYEPYLLQIGFLTRARRAAAASRSWRMSIFICRLPCSLPGRSFHSEF